MRSETTLAKQFYGANPRLYLSGNGFKCFYLMINGNNGRIFEPLRVGDVTLVDRAMEVVTVSSPIPSHFHQACLVLWKHVICQ